MELASVGASVVKIVSPIATKFLIERVSQTLNPTEFEKALTIAINTANKIDDLQKSWLCKRCNDKQLRDFLTQSFENQNTLEELQKLLKREGTINAVIIQKVFQQSADELNLELNPDRIIPWIETFTEIFFEKTAALRFQVAKEDYFKQVANWFDDVKFAGVSVPGNEIDKAATLAQIFVMPDVLEESQRPELVITASFDDRQAELFHEQRYRSQRELTGRRFSAAQLLKQAHSKAVLLGAPGTGKTTLMSYFAVMLAQGELEQLGTGELLPILIRIRDWARQPNISLIQFAHQYAEATMSVKALPEGFFEHWLERGHALILLDGLDEVPEESGRHHLVKCIENFLGQYRNNRAVITSRPASYRRDFFKTSEFPHYELLAFDDAKIKTFINHWYDSRIQDSAEAGRRKESLRKAISISDRIKLLVRNPLLLTIVALIHRYQAVLPKERHKLYDKAVETLLISWDAHKDLSNRKILKYLDVDDLRRLMEQLAYWIHTQGGVGDAEGGTVIDQDELLEHLSKLIKALKPVQLYEAKEEAKRFLKFIRERTGLVNEQGQNCYAFVHKTFQEYLCAQDIIYQADNEDDFTIILNHITDHLHDPHWHEVLLLLIAQQKPKKAAKAICTILEANSPYEQWLHRDLLFAGMCLGEEPKNLSENSSELVSRILTQLINLEVSNSLQVTQKLRDHILQVFSNLNSTGFKTQALLLLKKQEDQIERTRLLEYEIALEETDNVNEKLLELVKSERHYLHDQTLTTLTRFEKSHSTIETILNLTRHETANVRSNAVEVLGRLGNTSQLTLQSLSKLIKDKDIRVVYSCIEALRNLEVSIDSMLPELLPLLGHDSDDINSAVAELLGNMSNSSEVVMHSLLNLLDDTNDRVRARVALAFCSNNQSSKALVPLMLAKLKDESGRVRCMSALCLGYFGDNSEEVIKPLLRMLNDEDDNARFGAARALIKLGNEAEAVEILLSFCGKNSHPRRRFRIAFWLRYLSNVSDCVLQELLILLQDETTLVRRHAGDTLGKLSKKSDQVLPAVLEWLDRYQDSECAGAGIDALWEIVEG
jgi:HEAT repeat protein